MSSHHFVRDGQEPALFVLEKIPFSQVQPLLEWAPFILVSDRILEEVIAWGIKIDAVICRVEGELEILGQLGGIQFVEIATYKNASTLLTDGLKLLQGKKQEGVNITVTDGSLFIAQLTEFTPRISIVLHDSTMRWFPVSGSFQKWMPAGSGFILHKQNQEQVLNLSGFIEDGPWLRSEKDGMGSVSSPQLFWIGEPY
jgi:hypothetical protein